MSCSTGLGWKEKKSEDGSNGFRSVKMIGAYQKMQSLKIHLRLHLRSSLMPLKTWQRWTLKSNQSKGKTALTRNQYRKYRLSLTKSALRTMSRTSSPLNVLSWLNLLVKIRMTHLTVEWTGSELCTGMVCSSVNLELRLAFWWRRERKGRRRIQEIERRLFQWWIWISTVNFQIQFTAICWPQLEYWSITSCKLKAIKRGSMTTWRNSRTQRLETTLETFTEQSSITDSIMHMLSKL